MKNREIFDIYEEVFASNHMLKEGVIEAHIEKIKEMDKFLPPSSSFFIITDTTKGTFPFTSKNFEYNLGLDREQMKLYGQRYWLQHFYPDDLKIWIGILKDLMIYTMTEVEPGKRMRLSYTWNFRVKTIKGNYVNIFEHQVPIVLDEQFKPVAGIGHLTVTGSGEAMPLKASVKYLNEHDGYETLMIKNYSQKALSDGLSNRERDIIRYLSLRKTSKQIGELLYISPHTVDTHRRNILKKLKINSTGELIAYFRSQQLY